MPDPAAWWQKTVVHQVPPVVQGLHGRGHREPAGGNPKQSNFKTMRVKQLWILLKNY
ncbi:MAG TPA: hypothetical protein VKK79_22015 [Candidatus Lokiarchaeia archaeon]|nr:hypothetical protein [Candidatus Lokiarchaeia archaeon]